MSGTGSRFEIFTITLSAVGVAHITQRLPHSNPYPDDKLFEKVYELVDQVGIAGILSTTFDK